LLRVIIVFLGFTWADIGLVRPAGFIVGGDITCTGEDLKVLVLSLTEHGTELCT